MQHGVADSYISLLENIDAFSSINPKLVLGITATPGRSDGKALAKIYKKIVYSYDLRKAIENGYLSELCGIKVQTNTSLDGIKLTVGDFNAEELSDTINTTYRNQIAVKSWLEHGEGRQTICFTANIKHAQDLAAMFQHYGIKAEAVWGIDPDRANKLARYASGETTIILNCNLLTEGFDNPATSCILLASPTKSSIVYVQRVGRGTRLYPNKPNCLVIDLVDSFKNSLQTLPTLMGLNAKLDLKGKGLLWSVKEMEDAAKDYPAIDFSQLADIESLNLFIQNTNLFEIKFAEEVLNHSTLSWYTSPTGGYVMTLPKPEGSHWSIQSDKITITENLLGRFEVYAKIKGQGYRGERNTIEEAFSVADNLVMDKASEYLKLLKRKAEWHDANATEAQLKLLTKLVKKSGRVIPPGLSKGAASRLIGQLMANK